MQKSGVETCVGKREAQDGAQARQLVLLLDEVLQDGQRRVVLVHDPGAQDADAQQSSFGNPGPSYSIQYTHHIQFNIQSIQHSNPELEANLLNM